MTTSINNTLNKIVCLMVSALLACMMVPSISLADEVSADGTPVAELTSYAQEFTNIEAPVSSIELTAGTYTITANMGMMTPLGIYAYCTNPKNPWSLNGQDGIPAAPVSMNATLVVAKDGTKTLTIPLANPCFTVQNLEDGTNVHILTNKTTKTGLQAHGTAEKQEAMLADFAKLGYTDRWETMTVELGDWSGEYKFNNCREFATPLYSSPEYNNGVVANEITLTVDFNSAKKDINAAQDFKFVDTEMGVTVVISAEAGSPLMESLAKAELVVKADKIPTYNLLLKNAYISDPVYRVIDPTLVVDGTPIVLDDTVAATVTVNASASTEAAYGRSEERRVGKECRSRWSPYH